MLEIGCDFGKKGGSFFESATNSFLPFFLIDLLAS
jgi:hypothetical protein